jgi:hypothetical protein
MEVWIEDINTCGHRRGKGRVFMTKVLLGGREGRPEMPTTMRRSIKTAQEYFIRTIHMRWRCSCPRWALSYKLERRFAAKVIITHLNIRDDLQHPGTTVILHGHPLDCV